MSTDVEKLLRQDHIRPEELLTDGPNNHLNNQIFTEETTIGNTKGKKTKSKTVNLIHYERRMVVVSHEELLRVFFPIIAFCGSFLLFVQSLLAAAIILLPSPSH